MNPESNCVEVAMQNGKALEPLVIRGRTLGCLIAGCVTTTKENFTGPLSQAARNCAKVGSKGNECKIAYQYRSLLLLSTFTPHRQNLIRQHQAVPVQTVHKRSVSVISRGENKREGRRLFYQVGTARIFLSSRQAIFSSLISSTKKGCCSITVPILNRDRNFIPKEYLHIRRSGRNEGVCQHEVIQAAMVTIGILGLAKYPSWSRTYFSVKS